MAKSGIYKIANVITNKCYIGSAINLNRRFIEHRKNLKANNHRNSYLQNAYNKYQLKAFTFEIIEYVEDKAKLLEREQYWMDLYSSYEEEYGYNLSPTAGSNIGRKFSEEFKDICRKRMTGSNHSEETKTKMSNSHKARKRDPELGKKISAGKKGKGVGRKLPEIVKKNMVIAQEKRRDKEFGKYLKELICL